jgi:hypothetical protein
MISTNHRLAFLCIGVAALALAGCADTGSMQGFGGAAGRPKTVLVSDFLLSSDLAVIDRGYTARLERKVGGFPTHERKPRTIARVNDEIVASIIATVREAGLDAQPGSEDALKLSDDVLLVDGRLRPSDPAAVAKNKPVVFGSGRVTAEMSVSAFSGRGKKQLLTFSADAKDAGKPLTGKPAAARNAAIAEALAAQKSPPEKLSADVEGQARRLGRAVGEKIVAYAKGQGWLEKPAEAGEAQQEAQAEVLKLPEPKPAQKPVAAKKPAAQKPSAQKPEAPEDEEPPDTDVPDRPGNR